VLVVVARVGVVKGRAILGREPDVLLVGEEITGDDGHAGVVQVEDAGRPVQTVP